MCIYMACTHACDVYIYMYTQYNVHLMQIDANRMAQNISTLHRTWTIPTKFAICLFRPNPNHNPNITC